MNAEVEKIESPKAIALVRELRAVVGKLRRRLRDQTCLGDLTWSQVSVLGLLERDGPATVSTLARTEGMRQQSMGAIIGALESAGLVSGEPDPRDRRQTILSITDSGTQWIQVNRAQREDWLLHAIQNQLSAHEQDQLSETIGLLERLANS